MIRPVLSLERLSFLEPEGKVGYRYDQDRAEQEAMDYLEFIARVTSHIPDKGQVTIRYYGLYANAHRGKVRKASVSPLVLRMAEQEEKCIPSKGWAEMIRKVYEIDPMLCPKCGGLMKVVAFILLHDVFLGGDAYLINTYSNCDFSVTIEAFDAAGESALQSYTRRVLKEQGFLGQADIILETLPRAISIRAPPSP